MLFERETSTCARGCGEWIEVEWLRSRTVEGDLGIVDARTTSSLFCPVCRRRLELRTLSNAAFEACPNHGVWLMLSPQEDLLTADTEKIRTGCSTITSIR